MERFSTWLQYLQANPSLWLAAIGVLLGAYFLLNRKSRLTREADKRLAQLRKERGDYYRQLRPPR